MVRSTAVYSKGPNDLNYRRLQAWNTINDVFKHQPSVVEYLKEIEPKVELAEIAHFAKESSVSKALVEQFATAKQPPATFSIPSMRDRLAISDFQNLVGDDPALVATVLKLQSESLPLARLVKFIDHDPEPRKKLFEALIADSASVERIKNHMTLSVLADDVSFPLLKATEAFLALFY